MRILNIYVEGKGDMLFISHFLNRHYNLQFNIDVGLVNASCVLENMEVSIFTFNPNSGTGGINNDSISKLIKQIIDRDLPVGMESVLLIDADTPEHSNPKGGFLCRKNYLDTKLSTHPIKYFIIPDHKSDGNLEDLLHNSISDEGKQFYNCLCAYVACLQTITENKPCGIQEIDDFNKTRLEWYTYIMHGKSNVKKSKERNYLEQNLWDLNKAVLNPLKQFLGEFLNL